jgi:hypothetical protein
MGAPLPVVGTIALGDGPPLSKRDKATINDTVQSIMALLNGTQPDLWPSILSSVLASACLDQPDPTYLFNLVGSLTRIGLEKFLATEVSGTA